jgi:hypothetical protein
MGSTPKSLYYVYALFLFPAKSVEQERRYMPAPIHYGQTKSTPLVVFSDTCPVCKQRAQMSVTKQENFDLLIVIPLWKKGYVATCEKCAAVVGMDKTFGEELERSLKIDENQAMAMLEMIKNKYVVVKSKYEQI